MPKHLPPASKDFEKGQRVTWKWGQHLAYGEIAERYNERVVLTIKGKQIVRNASPEVPAYRIVQENGSEVLKLASELTAFDEGTL